MIEYALKSHPYRVRFSVHMDDPKILDHLQFTHLINMKFGGDVDQDSWGRLGNDVWWDVRFRDDDYSAATDAIDWCKLNIVEGQIKKSYHGALGRADPHAFIAKSLLGKLSALTE
ncbi:hypothetical protein [Mesorhizobium sp. ES1-3]|uniref:hypothetical protein n=1 Tax=Mesorhizobium sp. ES1-3 TaxID=2876628 RepID=UPI001CC9426A|nr:hypothetical protein [Mesorhizobium sp. ES1-3]MBZ9668708.1 hypothetical protein [Mesorhizobium sp. ES1-3]